MTKENIDRVRDAMQASNVILEGCDCTGKTSIAVGLQELFGMRIVKCSAPRTAAAARDEYFVKLVEISRKPGAVVDRFFMSEAVYAPMFRGYYPPYVRDMETKCMTKYNFMVLVTAAPETVAERFDGEFIKKEQIPLILKSFFWQYSSCRMPNKMTVDTTAITAAEAVRQIAEFVANARVF